MRCLVVLLGYHLVFANGQDGKSVDDLITEIFDAKNSQSDLSKPVPTVSPGQCECVPYYLCNNNTIITDGAGLIDIRYL